MKRIGKSTETNYQVYVNEQYYVVAQNGIIIGAVRYAFNDGEQWCFAIRLHSGDIPAHGVSRFEIGSHFDLIPGEPPWTMPVAQYRDPFADVVHAQALNEERLLLGYGTQEDAGGRSGPNYLLHD